MNKSIVRPLYMLTIVWLIALCLGSWFSYTLAFHSSKNNFAGYVLFAFVLIGVFFASRLARERVKLIKLFKSCSIEIKNKELVFSFPLGQLNLDFALISQIEVWNIPKVKSEESGLLTSDTIINIYTEKKVRDSINTNLKDLMPAPLLFEKTPLIKIPLVFKEDILQSFLQHPSLKTKIKDFKTPYYAL